MQNISGFGTKIRLVASVTFPNGIDISYFTDDADAVETQEIATAESAMGVNGHHVVWNKASPQDVAVNVIPRSPDDVNLMILLDANRTALGRTPARDEVSMVVVYPDGSTTSFNGGFILAGPTTPGVQSAGRLRTSTYRFRFEDNAKANW